MRRLILIIITVVVCLNIASCGMRDTAEIITTTPEPTKPAEPAEPTEPTKPAEPTKSTEPILTPTVPILDDKEIQLTEEEKEKLGVLIKWIYNSNLIYGGEDGLTLQLSDKIELLPTDIDKIKFVVIMAVYEHMIGTVTDMMLYSFTAEEADALIYAAVGDKFDEHKASEYVGDYTDGTYSYSMVGGDGATWWPDIEIDSVTLIAENEVRIEGVLKSEHDTYTEVYSYNFEAVAIKNPDSPFGGFTLKELAVH